MDTSHLLSQFGRALSGPVSFAVRDMLPPALWHYTTAAGFEGIVSNKHLRATNFSFMNDPSEVEYGRSLAEAVLADEERRQRAVRCHFVARTAANLRVEALSEIYVCCFTRLEDNLNQWRAYGSAAVARYSIGFDPCALQEAAFRVPGAIFDKVVYTEAEQTAHVRKIVTRAYEFLHRHAVSQRSVEEFAEIAAAHVARVIPVLKAGAYEAEAEWRVIILKATDDTRDVEFDTSRGVIRPYLRFSLAGRGNQLPIKSTYVLAPARPEPALKAARILLRKNRILEVTPRYSEVPFAD